MIAESPYPGERLGLPPAGQHSVAGRGIRFVSFLVDAAVLAAAGVLDDSQAEFSAFVIAVVALVVMPVRWGSTPGHAVTRLRTVAVVEDWLPVLDQRGLTVLTAIARALLWACAPVLFVVGIISMDRDGRTLWDRMTRTVLVER